MHRLFDAFWRALADSLRPRVLLLSILPIVGVGGLFALLGYFYWAPAVAGVAAAVARWSALSPLSGWFGGAGLGGMPDVIAPMLVLAAVIPAAVVLCLLLVSVALTPAMVDLVASRRFPALERRHGAGFWRSAATSIGCTLVALLALVASLPLWLVPPLVLVLPPLIWGWLAYRAMGFDVLADHASDAERRLILRGRRTALLAIGICTGYAGAAPSLVWAFGALTLVIAPLLIVVSIWLYTLVFLLSALWFAHYALAELDALRRAESLGAATPSARTALPLPLTRRKPS